MRRTLLTCLLLLLLASTASAASRVTVRGAGFGHGIGMSQYGAYGYAKHGRDFRQILGHYYTGTDLTRAKTKKVRVLLQSRDPYIRFRGAGRLTGVRNLNRRTTYKVSPIGGGRLGLYRRGKLIGRYKKLRVYKPGGVVRLLGNTINGIHSGRFHGAIDIVRSGGGVTAINRIGLDQYVKGVVAGEMPSSWAPEALKVQAVAARTYALATKKTGGSFDLYPDTRSQVYQGVAGETRATNAAVRGTAGIVVTYRGDPVVTYYFSTSGGQTENVENSFLGSEPKPWLKGVDDPYDDISPKHRWRRSFSTRGFDSSLGSACPGSFKKIRVLKRGVSPRVIRARVYCSGGNRIITGPQLRSRLGLDDTWMYFSTVSSSQARTSLARAARSGRRARRPQLTGTVDPAPRARKLAVERRASGRWRHAGAARVSDSGRYFASVRRAGVYRVRAGAVAGPAVRLR